MPRRVEGGDTAPTALFIPMVGGGFVVGVLGGGGATAPGPNGGEDTTLSTGGGETVGYFSDIPPCSWFMPSPVTTGFVVSV